MRFEMRKMNKQSMATKMVLPNGSKSKRRKVLKSPDIDTAKKKKQ